MSPYLIGLVTPVALAFLAGLAIYSPPLFAALMVVYGIAGWWKYQQWLNSLPPAPAIQPLPPPDPDGFARRVMMPPNGDVPAVPRTRKPRPYVGPPMKLPKGGLIG